MTNSETPKRDDLARFTPLFVTSAWHPRVITHIPPDGRIHFDPDENTCLLDEQ